MTTTMTDTRLATSADALNLARIHEAAWRRAYTGIIPYRSLNAMIGRRDASWWANTIGSGAAILVCTFAGNVVGYATLGRNRSPGLPVQGEIYELYLEPSHQCVGLGRRLFQSARQLLRTKNIDAFAVWTLAENTTARAFYERMGGSDVASGTERFDGKTIKKIAFVWQ